MQFDNLCKYLAEKYPDRFASWLLGPTTRVEVLKTELSLEPIRADSVTLLRTQARILHLEFQVQVSPGKPMPLRMLNYWVRLHWQYALPVTQVLIWLKPTANSAVFENEFQLELTRHGYQVIRMWEQSPEVFLQDPALLPLAVLAASENSTQLLNRVAAEVDKIEEITERREISSCAQILAGLRFKKDVIRKLFREEIMRESVIYQDIIQKGLQEGREQGLQEGLQEGREQGLQEGLQEGCEQGREQGRQEELSLIMRLLTRKIGTLDPELQERLQRLSFAQLADLGEALLDFSEVSDLAAWLQNRV